MKTTFTFAVCLILTACLQSQVIIRVTPTGTGDGTSWTNACSLETAISVVERSRNDPDASTPLSDRVSQIWIQKGTYYPSKMLIVPDSVKIYGGFAGVETALSQRNFAANPTIVDGQQKIGSIFRLENSVTIDGFTIQNGNANGNPHKNGGGVWADENCTIVNCIITNNTATLNGGGVYAKGMITMTNCVIKQNTANSNGNNTFGNCLELDVEQSGISSGIDIAGCNPGILYLGKVGFKSEKTVPVTVDDVTLTWSDAVIAEGCNKNYYQGGASGNYYSDCRINSNRTAYGDLFSWCAVARFAHVLCPSPWRVPFKEDFYHLDKAMGGNGDGSGPSPNGAAGNDGLGKYYTNTAVRNNYLNIWNGGSYGGSCEATGALGGQSTTAYFWMQVEYSSNYGFRSYFGSNSRVLPQGYYDKFYGFQLRCVK